MKIIVYSDIQFNAWSEFSKILPNGLNSRFQDQLNVQDEIFEFAKNQKDGDDVLLIHTGDLFESMTEKISKQVFLEVYERFSKFSKENIPVILLVGNHDWIDRTETSHMIEPFKEIENILIVDKPEVQTIDRTCLCFMPYTGRDFKKEIGNIKEQIGYQGDLKYLFSHQGVSGAKVGPRDVPLKHEYTYHDFGVDYFDLIFNGHYHKMQIFGSGFIIVGSPIQKDFGERNDPKGFWFLDTKVKPRRPNYIKTHSPNFFKIQIDEMSQLEGKLVEKNEDFLWIVAMGLKETEIKNDLFVKGYNLNNVRIDIEEKKELRTRTDISLNMTVEDQFKRAVEYMLHQSGLELDMDKTLLKLQDLFHRSQ